MTHHHQLPYLLNQEIVFPDVEFALDDPNGLLAVGGDLSRERLMLAYQSGVFPWFSDPDPILWWSPDPRAVLFLDELKVTRSLAKSIRNRGYEIWINKDFKSVMENCSGARKNETGTWITSEMKDAYFDLHEIGAAHCVSVYDNDKLIGGLYGLSQGLFFFGESMFSQSTDASKVALYYLVQHLKTYGFKLIDCQVPNNHLTSLGSRNIDRTAFIGLLEQWVNSPQDKTMWQRSKVTCE